MRGLQIANQQTGDRIYKRLCDSRRAASIHSFLRSLGSWLKMSQASPSCPVGLWKSSCNAWKTTFTACDASTS